MASMWLCEVMKIELATCFQDEEWMASRTRKERVWRAVDAYLDHVLVLRAARGLLMMVSPDLIER